MASWEELARNFLLQEEEEDEDLLLVILPAIMHFLQEEKTPEHTCYNAPAAPTSSAPVSDSTSLFDGLDVSSVQNEVQSTGDSLQAARGKRKRNQSHIAASIDGLVELRKVQATKTMAALEEKKKQEEAFSVDKCLDEVDAMPLTDVEKACAMNIFKSEIDREVFMKMKNQNVRLIWLKQEISAISRGHV